MTDAPHDSSEGYINTHSHRGMHSRHQFLVTPKTNAWFNCDRKSTNFLHFRGTFWPS